MGKEYTIRGVTVNFPYNAYPSQLSMMSKILTGLTESSNCLLESPTGSGKSLALLCSTLSWQAELSLKYKKYMGFSNNLDTVEDMKRNDATQKLMANRSKRNWDKNGGCEQNSQSESSSKPVEKPPVIFYCTRTHKQIKQIITELAKLPQANKIKMTILSSRDHTCVYEDDANQSSFVDYSHLSKNERCRKLLDSKEAGECMFYNGLQRALREPSSKKSQTRLTVSTEPWDIEDIVQHGKNVKVCPYFLSRELQKNCDIIFCPYNYVIDPRIRKSLDIQLENSVVILDEAHNIEDVSRSAGSVSSTFDDLDATNSELQQIINNSNVKEEVIPHYQTLKQLISCLCDFTLNYGKKLVANQFQETNKVLTGCDFLRLLESNYNLNKDAFKLIMESIYEIQTIERENADESFTDATGGDANVSRSSKARVKLSGDSWSLIDSVSLSLEFLFKSSVDFKIVLIKKYDKYRVSRLEKEKKNSRTSSFFSQDNWIRKSKLRSGGDSNNPASLDASYEVIFNIWCMNPSTVFNDIASKSRSIILASGTLSPIDTFASELGCPFPVQLEAPHVIKKNQIWVGALSQGVANPDVSLRATYQNIQTLSFQDEVGNVVYEICRIIPHGVLLFLPSYKLLTLLVDRWRTTGHLSKLNEIKSVFQEPQKGGSRELNEVIAQYTECIDTASQGSKFNCGQGALLIAVCRGKVSEGIDFADNQARAVITLGIPYPNFKDLQVELKRGFNDQFCSSRKLLSGSEWYEIQAFRALNQALGRCIRHRNDWGAVILIDERFVRNPVAAQKYVKSLPKWIRGFFNQPQNLLDSLQTLKTFVDSQNIPIKSIGDQNAFETPSVPQSQCVPSSNGLVKVEADDLDEPVAALEQSSNSFRFDQKNETTEGPTDVLLNQFQFIGLKRKAVSYSHSPNVSSSGRSGSKVQHLHVEMSPKHEADLTQENNSISSDCKVICESPLLDDSSSCSPVVSFKYPGPSDNRSNDDDFDNDVSMSPEVLANSTCLSELNAPEKFKASTCSKKLFEESMEILDDSLEAIPNHSTVHINGQVDSFSADSLYCPTCSQTLNSLSMNQIKEVDKEVHYEKVIDVENIISVLQTTLPVSIVEKFLQTSRGSDPSATLFALNLTKSRSQCSSVPLHFDSINQKKNGVELNCCYDAELDVIYQPFLCSNRPNSSICALKILKQRKGNSETAKIPSVLLWAFTGANFN